MAITKCRIWLRSVTAITVAPRALHECAHTSDGWSALAWMEKIVTKTNSEGRTLREPKERELRDDELALVSGGALYTHLDQLEGAITTNGFSSWTELYTFRFGW
jgi:hypothetical protein